MHKPFWNLIAIFTIVKTWIFRYGFIWSWACIFLHKLLIASNCIESWNFMFSFLWISFKDVPTNITNLQQFGFNFFCLVKLPFVVTMTAPIIIKILWAKSVQITAERPPTIVNTEVIASKIMIAIYIDALWFSSSKSVKVPLNDRVMNKAPAYRSA